MSCAPKLPYDVDLFHWEDEKLVAPSIEMYVHNEIYQRKDIGRFCLYKLLPLIVSVSELKRMVINFGHRHKIEQEKELKIRMG